MRVREEGARPAPCTWPAAVEAREAERAARVPQGRPRNGSYGPGGLAPQMRLFVVEYMKEVMNGSAKKNATAAAVRAGYSPATAQSQASRLLDDPLVQAAIEREMERLAERASITPTAVLADIKEIGDRCLGGGPEYNPFAALRSRELLGKHLELFTEKVKTSGDLEVTVQVQEIRAGKMPKSQV